MLVDIIARRHAEIDLHALIIYMYVSFVFTVNERQSYGPTKKVHVTIDQGPIDPEIVELFLESEGGTVSAVNPVSNTAVNVEFEKEEGVL